MEDVHIEPFAEDMTTEVSEVLARAFVTNPVNIAALGPARLARNRMFFREGLRRLAGQKWVAVEGSFIVGFIHWTDFPGCRISGTDKVRMIPMLVERFGLPTALRIGVWQAGWSRRDPKKPHCHLGPIGVEPAEQGRGIGRLLMERYCEAMDAVGMAGYLETDRPGNVPFYQLFGFETIAEVSVLGIPNYFMWRKAGLNRSPPTSPERE